MRRYDLILFSLLLLSTVLLLVPQSVFSPFTWGDRNQQLSQNAVATQRSSPALTELELVGWYSYWDERALESLRTSIKQLSIFSPMFYHMAGDGSLGKYRISNSDEVLSLARDNNIPLAPSIGDEGDYRRIRTLLYDDSVRLRFGQQLVTEAQIQGYTGWTVDIEILDPTDQEAFSQFITELANLLHRHDLELRVVVFGRSGSDSHDAALAHDYEALGRVADQLQLMLFGYHNEDTKPGGQAPLEWYREVLLYAVQRVPREKILVGLSSHGYEWGESQAVGLTTPQIYDRMERYRASARYDRSQLSAVVRYQRNGEQRTIWFENNQALIDKVLIARKEFGINSFGIWRIGADDPAIWEQLRGLEDIR